MVTLLIVPADGRRLICESSSLWFDRLIEYKHRSLDISLVYSVCSPEKQQLELPRNSYPVRFLLPSPPSASRLISTPRVSFRGRVKNLSLKIGGTSQSLVACDSPFYSRKSRIHSHTTPPGISLLSSVVLHVLPILDPEFCNLALLPSCILTVLCLTRERSFVYWQNLS